MDRATSMVVEPPSKMTVSPSTRRSTAATAIAVLASMFSRARISKGASSALRYRLTAPPWTRPQTSEPFKTLKVSSNRHFGTVQLRAPVN